MKFKTKIEEFDDLLNGGINHHSLVYISGPKESGKTGFVNLIMENISRNQVSTGFFSLEFEPHIYHRYLTAKYKNQTQDWVGSIYTEGKITDILDIEKKIIEWYSMGARVFFIDSILRITHNLFSGSGTATDDIYLRLEALKKELDIVIIITTKLTKISYEIDSKSLYNARFADDKADIWLHLSSKEILIKKVEIIKNKQSNNFKTFDFDFNKEWYK